MTREHPQDTLTVILHADSQENHMDVASHHIGMLPSVSGKYRVGHPNQQGMFLVQIPHATTATRAAIEGAGIALATEEEIVSHQPLPTSALAAFRDRLTALAVTPLADEEENGRLTASPWESPVP